MDMVMLAKIKGHSRTTRGRQKIRVRLLEDLNATVEGFSVQRKASLGGVDLERGSHSNIEHVSVRERNSNVDGIGVQLLNLKIT